MVAQNDIFSDSWCDIVFEDRNQMYVGYDLRKRYAKNIFIAVMSAILFFFFTLSIPTLVRIFKAAGEDAKVKIAEVTTLAEPPPIDKDEPPPPPVEPPPPLKSTIKFTPPVIVKDEEVQEEPPPTQEQLKDVDVGAKTQEGDSLHGVDPSLGEGNKVIDDEANKIFTIVEQMPGFPGGDGELMKYLSKNIRYPGMARENGISGKVILTFVVNKEGKVTDVKVLRGIGGGCDEEAMRVVSSMPPWKPGKQNGLPVLVQYNLPVNFKLQ